LHVGDVTYIRRTLIVLFPEVEPTSTVICLVPWPDAIVSPAGTDHRYSVGPPKGITGGLSGTLNTSPETLGHVFDGPVIGEGRLRPSRMVRVTMVAGLIH